MLDKETMVTVRNRDNGSVGYTIPDLGNLHRNFQPGEVKTISVEELRKLSYIPGGMPILENCLLIENEECRQELVPDAELEYSYTEEDIKNLLLKGSLDALLDCLDFAPNGVIELVKQFAVDLKINDIQKRDAIFTKTGFNVTKAIEINKETENPEDNEIKIRRVSSNNITDQSAARRVPVSKYKVVMKKD